MHPGIRKAGFFAAVFVCILLVITGFRFASAWAGIIFVVLLCAISLPLELLASAIPRALFELGKLSRQAAQVLFVILDAAATAAVLGILDYFMHDVSIMPVSALIIALVLAFFSLGDFSEKLERTKRESE